MSELSNGVAMEVTQFSCLRKVRVSREAKTVSRSVPARSMRSSAPSRRRVKSSKRICSFQFHRLQRQIPVVDATSVVDR
jgi:hypothetical protein